MATGKAERQGAGAYPVGKLEQMFGEVDLVGRGCPGKSDTILAEEIKISL